MTGPAPTVLVTGANSGIGLAAVAELLDRGVQVVATVGSDAAAETVAALDGRGTLQIERLDVTDATRCAEVIEAHRPDVLVNNAGAATTRRPRRVYRVGFGSRLGVLSNVVPKAVEDRIAAVLFRLGS